MTGDESISVICMLTAVQNLSWSVTQSTIFSSLIIIITFCCSSCTCCLLYYSFFCYIVNIGNWCKIVTVFAKVQVSEPIVLHLFTAMLHKDYFSLLRIHVLLAPKVKASKVGACYVTDFASLLSSVCQLLLQIATPPSVLIRSCWMFYQSN